jgi:hypothetical protein
VSYFDDNEARIINGGQRFGGKRSPTAKCKHCGSTAVKWRLGGGEWRLYDLARVHPGNFMPPHQCTARQASPDDFDDLTEEKKQ